MAAEIKTDVVVTQITTNVASTSISTPATVPGTDGITTSVSDPSIVTSTTGVTEVTTSVTEQAILVTEAGGITVTVPGVISSAPTTGGFIRRLDEFLADDTNYSFSALKASLDSIFAGDQYSKVSEFIREYPETVSTTQLVNILLETKYNDSALGVEYFAKLVDKTVAELEFVTDVLEFNISINKSETLSSAEDYRNQVLKAAADYVNTIVDAPTYTYLKSLVEILNITDDYYGLANIDDDQYANFNKTVNTWLETTTAKPVFDISAVLIDVAAYSEVLPKALLKQLAPDNFTATTTSVLKTPIKAPVDTLALPATEEYKFTIKPYWLSPVMVNTTAITELAKIFASNASIADSIPVFVDNKGLVDLLGPYDDKAANLARPLFDLVNILAIPNFTTARTVSDLFTAMDFTVFKSINSVTHDITNTVETLAIATNKLLVDLFISTDIASNSTTKALDSDQISITDIYSRLVIFNREIADLVNSTDDYYGLANVDDDQFAQFNKTLASSLDAQELFSRAWQALRSASEFNTVTDITDLIAGKNSVDSINLTDATPIKEFYKLNLEQQTLIESLTRSWFPIRAYTDTATATDTDDKKVDFGKVFAEEPITVQDLYSHIVTFRRQVDELVNSTDDYYGLANVDDDQFAQFNKTIQIVASVAESFNRLWNLYRSVSDLVTNITDVKSTTTGKNSLDSLTTSDSYSSTRTFNRQFLELTAIADPLAKSIRPGTILDVVQFTDSKAATLTKPFTDLTAITEFSKFTVSKAFADSITNTDLAVTSYVQAGAGKQLADLLTISSSVTINKQNYFASDYVTAGYAGTNTSST